MATPTPKAGNAGCSAACSAVENGAKVLVCEKTAQVNGRGGVVGTFDMPPETGYFVPTALLYKSSVDQGAEYMFETPAVQLVQDEDGAVLGAIVETADGHKKILASKGTILATGDIAGDPEMMSYYCESRMQRILRSDYSVAADLA